MFAVNHQSSFDVCLSDGIFCNTITEVSRGSKTTCCGDRVLAWRGSGATFVQSFLHNILRRIDPNGQDSECSSNVTFHVNAVSIITEESLLQSYHLSIDFGICSSLFCIRSMGERVSRCP